MWMRIVLAGVLSLNFLFFVAQPRGEEIESMNQVPVPDFSEWVLKAPTPHEREAAPLSLLIVGNSLTFHGAAPGIGWDYAAGMAASSQAKDYVHLLAAKLNEAFKTDIVCRFSNFADFERNPAEFDLRKIDKLLEFKPAYVIFQLGENVGQLPDFEKASIQLVQRIQQKQKGVRILFTTPFFPSLEKNKLMQRVCSETGSFLVDLSHLKGMDPATLAKNETGRADKALWKSDGIGIHPGDYGMEMIAQLLFIQIQALQLLD